MELVMSPARTVRRAFERAMATAPEQPGIVSALLATRDGLMVASSTPEIPHPDVVAAMHAAALGAAEMTLKHLGPTSHLTLTAEVGERRFVARTLTADLFGVVLLDASADCASVGRWLTSLSDALARA